MVVGVEALEKLPPQSLSDHSQQRGSPSTSVATAVNVTASLYTGSAFGAALMERVSEEIRPL